MNIRDLLHMKENSLLKVRNKYVNLINCSVIIVYCRSLTPGQKTICIVTAKTTGYAPNYIWFNKLLTLPTQVFLWR